MKTLLSLLLIAGMMGCAGKSSPVIPEAVVTEVAASESAKKVEKSPKESNSKAVLLQLQKLAEAAEPDVLAKKGKILADVQAEHAKDVEAYRFKVSRWGEWLEMSIARKARDSEKMEKFSTSINLGLVTTVRLEGGHGPDEEGELNYYASLEESKKPEPTKDDHSGVTFSSGPCYGYELEPAPKGYRWKVAPDLPTVPYRLLFQEIKQEASQFGGFGYCSGAVGVAFETGHFPRFAQDDVIYFDGIAQLYAPAGLGEKVYRQILAAKDEPK